MNPEFIGNVQGASETLQFFKESEINPAYIGNAAAASEAAFEHTDK